MAITTRAGLLAAMRSATVVEINKTATLSTGASIWTTAFAVAGSPVGVLAGTSTTQGVVPDDSTAGCPSIDSFGGLTGYVAAIDLSTIVASTVQARFSLSDLLFKSGAHAFNAADTLASQPSYSARIPGGDYKGTEIWIEWVTASTGNPLVTVTYTDDKGNAGQSTSFTYLGTTAIGQMHRMDLAAPSEGVQKIESVTCTTAVGGTFNVIVLRPLVRGIQTSGPTGAVSVRASPDQTALPIVFDTSALYVTESPSSVSIGAFNMLISIVRG